MKAFLRRNLIGLSYAVFHRGPVWGIRTYVKVMREFHQYRALLNGNSEVMRRSDFWPSVLDRDLPAGGADLYFYQDSWCARHIFATRPASHVDVGSALSTAGLISQFTNLVYVDIRPVAVNLAGFTFKNGTLLNLPFESWTVQSLSSLSVVEHVGLGRYGDPLDPLGTDKACAELSRVLAPDGRLYVAVPTEKTARTVFNAHRIFAPDSFIEKFSGLTLVDEKYATLQGLKTREQYEAIGMPYAFGCFCFSRHP